MVIAVDTGVTDTPIAHLMIVVTLPEIAETPGAIHPKTNSGGVSMSDDGLGLEDPCGLFKVISTDSEDIGGTVMNDRVPDGHPVLIIAAHHTILGEDIPKQLRKAASELRILLIEAPHEVLVVAEKELDAGNAVSGHPRLVAFIPDDQGQRHIQLIQLVLKIGVGSFIGIMWIEGAAIGNVSVEDDPIDSFVAHYNCFRGGRKTIRSVQVGQHQSEFAIHYQSIIVDDLISTDRTILTVEIKDAALIDTTLLEQDVSSLPEMLISLILTVLMVRILICRTKHRSMSVGENKPVDDGHHMRICKGSRRSNEIAEHKVIWGRTSAKLVPCAVHDHLSAVKHRIEAAEGRLYVRSDVLLITERDLSYANGVLNNVITVSTLGVEVS